jgi:hypothetical protein
VPDDGVDVQQLRLDQLAPREGEELPCQRGRPLRGAADLAGVFPPGIVGIQVALQQIAESQDRGQHVVQVVRDSAGEAAHRLHAEGLLQVLLGPAPLGEIEHDTGEVVRLVGGGIHRALAD